MQNNPALLCPRLTTDAPYDSQGRRKRAQKSREEKWVEPGIYASRLNEALHPAQRELFDTPRFPHPHPILGPLSSALDLW